MKIAIISGSPKGELSVTLQYAKYIAKKIPEHQYDYFHIGKEIQEIEKDKAYLLSIINSLAQSDAIIWAFPVYIYLVPSQMKRFIELLFENGGESVFKGKYATSLTTSTHFYDHAAHNYIHGISEDLGMNYVEGFSAGMEDLLDPEWRTNLVTFAKNFLDHVSQKLPVPKKFYKISYQIPEFKPVEIEETLKKGRQRIVLITDAKEEDKNLIRMIGVFLMAIPNPVEVININELNIDGGCLGCIMCGYDGTCVYNDDYANIFRKRIITADAVIFAHRIVDRFLSSSAKMFMDRMFFNGHRPVFMDKQFGFLISGPLRQIANLQEILTASAEVGRANLVGIVTDEYEDSAYLTALIQNFAKQLVRAIEEKAMKPFTFLGEGGHKILRDLIYDLKPIFIEDYRFYKKHGLIDFPQDNINKRIRNLFLGGLMMIPKVRKEIYKEAKQQIVRPLREIVESYIDDYRLPKAGEQITDTE